MRDTVYGVEFEYEKNRYFGNGPTVVFLHGWGGDLRSFAGAFKTMEKLGISAVNVAFPKTVPPEWGVFDYAVFMQQFFEREGIASPIVVGHSFGGRIAIILAARGLCGKLVLVDAAGIKPRFSISKKIKVARYHRRVKRGKPLDGFGSVDYNNTSGDGRAVFVRIVNTHLDRLLPYIQCPTLIIWGKHDTDTPPYMAHKLKRGIKNSRLVFIDGGHYGYIDSDYKFIGLLKNFIAE